jgi:DNA modification methylase
MDASISSGLSITYQPVTALKPRVGNARTHSKHQIRQIAASIREFGFTNPILVDRNNIIAGHGRVEAARMLRIAEVPTIGLDTLTPDQIRAYVIADNRLAEKAGWDESILAIELQHLLTLDDFDLTITGFDVPEIDLILQGVDEKPDNADENIEAVGGLPATQPGDLWQLGSHRILCGSSLAEPAFSTLLGRRRANVVFTDPPYNVAIEGNVCGKGSVHHREFAMASGEMNAAEFVAFLISCLNLLHRFSVAGSVHYICMDWRHIGELLDAGRKVYEQLLNLCVWVKDNGGMGSFYRSRHELVFVFRKGKEQYRNNVQLGQYGRNRTNVWEYPGVNTLSKTGEEGSLLALHPTVKPIALVADALLDCSARGDIVLDGFLGSGTTLMAAERVGRACYGIEIDPLYVDVAIRRWQRHTGGKAIHEKSGKCFDDMATTAEVCRG